MRTWTYDYVELPEPQLRFHSQEKRYVSPNPIEGLKAWGPYDGSIPGALRPHPVRLAIVCPENGFGAISGHLQKLQRPMKSHTSDEYVEDWPGFHPVFRANIEIPDRPDHPLVLRVPDEEIREARHSPEPEVAFLELLKRHIGTLVPRRHEFHVVIIYIPDGWAAFRGGREAGYDYDLHDALKVYGAPNNLFFQLVNDKSLRNTDQARVLWWLALALYVKAGGIPWKLDEAADGTAFVGLSYGISNARQQRIVMGCSQVFDENGEGLRFLLYPLESPAIMRGKNPFLAQEDARRLFSRVRDIYQGANGRTARRVVVHKTTHFTREEMDGIALALAGVEDVELLQIQQATDWRAIAFDQRRNDVHMFPVKRGTVVPLDPYAFLLWTQGNVLGVARNGRSYYQEKNSIPRPLMVRRFRGSAPIEQVAGEILRLTKMNWNNHQLYDVLPVTIKFSNELSAIAKQVHQSWQQPYDFRYFM